MAVSSQAFESLPPPYVQLRPALQGEKFEPMGVGYALSGGGYKAALFHLGGLIRLNELGWLGKIDRFSSVSGGSIVAAVLAAAWTKLQWDDGVAQNFDLLVTRPMVTFCATANIDKPCILKGLIPGFSAPVLLEKAYDKLLFHGVTLSALPSGAGTPRFVFNATNVDLDSLWRISRDYAADWQVGSFAAPNFPLAKVVAASSGFPPFFTPVTFDLSGLKATTDLATHLGGDYQKTALTGDGGIYDNMGLEAVWKRYGVLLVSNAGDPIKEGDRPRGWFRRIIRVTGLIHRQAENNRVRWLMDQIEASKGQRRLAYWPGRTTVERLAPGLGLPALSLDDAAAAATEEVRLRPLSQARITRLVRHGYTLANAAAVTRLGASAQTPVHLPGPF